MPTHDSLTSFATLPPAPIPWLWPGRLPVAQISLLVSRPGVAKSLLTTDLAARISTGSPWPDGSTCPQGSVILISLEDDPAQVIRPRLLAHNADLSKIHILTTLHDLAKCTTTPDLFFNIERYAPLEDALSILPDCKLVIFDPIAAFFPGSDIRHDPIIRKSLSTLFHLAQRYGPAILLVHHLRNRDRGYADQRILGGSAFTSISRNIWHLMRDPEQKSRRLFLSGKSNFAPESPALAFTITNTDPSPNAPTDSIAAAVGLQDTPRIVWDPQSIPLTADEALATLPRLPTGPPPLERRSAETWLKTLLQPGPCPPTKSASNPKTPA
jgi:hypothetical protein